MESEETKVEEVVEATEPVEVEPVKEPIGIENTLEVVKALEFLTEIAEGVFADGKLDGADFLVVASKLKKLDIVVDAVSDIDKVDDELKDLDEAELMQLGVAAYRLVKKVIAAAKKNKDVA